MSGPATRGFRFSPVDRKSAAEIVAESLRKAILGGHLAPGDRLPSERELAEQFQVNRSTVREALKRLETLGLVSIQHGGATRVADFLYEAGLQLLPFLLEVGGQLDLGLVRDLLELRVMLLEWTGRAAAKRASEEDIQELQKLLAAMSESLGQPSRLKELDFHFFDRLVRATGNRVLTLVTNVIRKVYLKGPPWFDVLYAPANFGLDQHEALLAALRAGDPHGAGASMAAYARRALDVVEVVGAVPAEEGEGHDSDE